MPTGFRDFRLELLTAADQHAAAEDEWNEWTGMEGLNG